MKKILIVDDESSIRSLVKRILAKTHIVLEACDGVEAVKVARTGKPDLILMDIMMPKMDGYAACSLIKGDPELTNIPVIMVTALGFQLNKELATKLGSDGYVTKPFSPEILRTTIDQCLGSK